ncbi:SGNH/GDSL hydrolase family protein [Rubrolithibacter danxiaensis]|uniref:SGNH/GDSL hydrolase family protein n=1 Tax=Rubrolithibacter danxiaensis TaxID=3390805 RepID=UPI003BF7D034
MISAIKTLIKVFYLLFLLFIGPIAQAQKLPPEFIPRKGLPNFLYKVQKSTDTVTIAYLGGSITEAHNGWRDQTFSWMQKQYPKVTFKQVDAAIGGTTSELGVYRLEEHVLNYKPDLLFVEFAVNDDENTRESVLTAMEGIVRKTWLAHQETDICFIYTFADYMLKNYNNEGPPPTVKIMEEIADYYSIPSVNLSPKIVQLINNKKLYPTGKPAIKNDSTFFSADGVHPYPETGHALYAESIINSIKRLRAAGTYEHPVGAAYFSKRLDQATMVSPPSFLNNGVEKISVTDNSDELISRYSRYLTHVYKLKDTSDVLSFSFTGESIGFLDIIGPASAPLKVSIDNYPPRYINRFDKYCFYTRLAFFFIDGLENKQHKAIIQLSSKKFDKFQVIEKKPGEVENPEQYSEFSWMVGRILVNGEVNK